MPMTPQIFEGEVVCEEDKVDGCVELKAYSLIKRAESSVDFYELQECQANEKKN